MFNYFVKTNLDSWDMKFEGNLFRIKVGAKYGMNALLSIILMIFFATCWLDLFEVIFYFVYHGKSPLKPPCGWIFLELFPFAWNSRKNPSWHLESEFSKKESVIRFISEKKSSENLGKFTIFDESILDRVEASKAYYNLGVSYAEMHKYDKVPWWQFLFGATGGKIFFNKNATKDPSATLIYSEVTTKNCMKPAKCLLSSKCPIENFKRKEISHAKKTWWTS